MKFRVSPQAFFQVNTLGAEVLYKTAIELAELTTDTALLDVCCGTGTIGLCFSKVILNRCLLVERSNVSYTVYIVLVVIVQHCDEVMGIEIIADAIKDARENAVKNGVTNCEFFVGKAEDILWPVIRRTTKSNIIAIVDPPRAGLRESLIQI